MWAVLNLSQRFYHYKSDIKVLRKIKQYQNLTDFLISRTSFAKTVYDVMTNVMKDRQSYCIQCIALKVLQEATESFIVSHLMSELFALPLCIIFEFTDYFSDANLLVIHVKHVTLQMKDMRLLKQLMKNLGLKIFDYD